VCAEAEYAEAQRKEQGMAARDAENEAADEESECKKLAASDLAAAMSDRHCRPSLFRKENRLPSMKVHA
jgi:hypothetical protein